MTEMPAEILREVAAVPGGFEYRLTSSHGDSSPMSFTDVMKLFCEFNNGIANMLHYDRGITSIRSSMVSTSGSTTMTLGLSVPETQELVSFIERYFTDCVEFIFVAERPQKDEAKSDRH